jgi:hypothetical protein
VITLRGTVNEFKVIKFCKNVDHFESIVDGNESSQPILDAHTSCKIIFAITVTGPTKHSNNTAHECVNAFLYPKQCVKYTFVLIENN